MNTYQKIDMKQLFSIIALVLSLTIITPPMAHADPSDKDINHIQSEYGRLKYQVSSQNEKLKGIQELNTFTADLHTKHPDALEPLVWRGLVLATEADFRNNRSALPVLDEARDLLEKAVDKNPKAMDAIAPTSLGALYFQAPGWPLSFGDTKKARTYLDMAKNAAPDAIDLNYFYGKYLVERRKYKDAISYFEKGLKAEPREGLEIADNGRLKELEKELKNAKAYARYE